MSLHIVRNDITKMEVDAIVNAANESLLGGGGVDGQIHAAAGPGLLEECKTLGGCKTGEAKITRAYNLPCKYVIHTVGPVYKDGNHNEEKLLKSCYENSLKLAEEYKVESIAFPLISAGVYNYPKREAFWIAVQTITDFLTHSDMDAYLVVFNREFVTISNQLQTSIEEYIDDTYEEKVISLDRYRNVRHNEYNPAAYQRMAMLTMPSYDSSIGNKPVDSDHKKLKDELNDLDESFSEMLLRVIDAKGLKDPEVYKKANIDRKLFSKIRSDANYKPSKQTAIAFAIALELSLPQSKSMLKKAGFALSHSRKDDIIVEFFIRNKIYDIYKLNEALYSFDLPTLGTL